MGPRIEPFPYYEPSASILYIPNKWRIHQIIDTLQAIITGLLSNFRLLYISAPKLNKLQNPSTTPSQESKFSVYSFVDNISTKNI